MDFLVIAAANKGGNETDGSVIENFPDVKSLVCRDIPDLFAGDLNHDGVSVVRVVVFLNQFDRLVDIAVTVDTPTCKAGRNQCLAGLSPIRIARGELADVFQVVMNADGFEAFFDRFGKRAFREMCLLGRLFCNAGGIARIISTTQPMPHSPSVQRYKIPVPILRSRKR